MAKRFLAFRMSTIPSGRGRSLLPRSLSSLPSRSGPICRCPAAKTHRIGVVLGLRLVAVVLLYHGAFRHELCARDELHVESVCIVAVDTSGA